MFTPSISPEVQAAISMGPAPVCRGCGKQVVVQMIGQSLVYHCHGAEEQHPNIAGWQHPEKAF